MTAKVKPKMPTPEEATEHTIYLSVALPVFGRPDQDLMSAARAKHALQLSLHGAIDVWMTPANAFQNTDVVPIKIPDLTDDGIVKTA